MKKKFLFLLITMILFTGLLGLFLYTNEASAIMYYSVESEGVEYECYPDGTAKVKAASSVTGSAIIIQSPFVLEGTPYTVNEVKNQAFYDCDTIEEITIPDSVTRIGYEAFYSCSNLKSITFGPASILDSIGEKAFNFCTALTEIHIPDSVTSIGNMAFSQCEALAVINLGSSASTSKLSYIGTEAFQGCKMDHITIPDKVTVIDANAFSGCTNLTSITIPSNVETIGDGAFCYCDMLETVNMDNATKLTTIGNAAFYSCNSLKSINIPDSVIFLGNTLFIGCNKLEGITIGDGVTQISEGLFSYLESLKTVVIGNGVTSIGIKACYGSYLLNSVTLGSKVETIGALAFMDCSKLTFIAIPDSVTSIGNSAFNGCTAMTMVSLGTGPASSKLISIGGSAFSNCVGITEINIPNTVQTINDGAFLGCKGLSKITLSSDAATSELVNIGHSAFSFCDAIEDISIPDSVEYIGNNAFLKCINLKNVVIGETSALNYIGGNAFSMCDKLTTFYIPKGVTTIAGSPFSYSPSLMGITVDSANNYYSTDSSGVLFDYNKTQLMQYPTGRDSAIYTIPDTVTMIGDYAFMNSKISGNVTISAKVSYIGDDAFSNCKNIENFTVDSSNFYYSSIEGVLFDKSGTMLFQYPMANTRTSYEFPASVTDINMTAMNGLKYLKDINVDASNSKLSSKSGVLYDKSGVILMKYPVGRTEQFYTVPEGTIEIVPYAFEKGINLKGIILPDSIIAIDDFGIEDKENIILYVSEKYATENASVLAGYNYVIGGSKFISIQAPASITGLPNGTAKTAAAFGLPSTVTIVTSSGNASANVTWNVNSCTYNPSSSDAQSFTVTGTITLPTGVINIDNISLTVTTNVSVNKNSNPGSDSGTGGNGTGGSGTGGSGTGGSGTGGSGTGGNGTGGSGTGGSGTGGNGTGGNGTGNNNSGGSSGTTPPVTDSNLPSINGSKIKGWDSIIDSLAGNNVVLTINMNGSTIVNHKIFETIQGRNCTVTFVLDNGIQWVINGKDIPKDTKNTKLPEIDLKISLNTNNIPKKLLENLKVTNRVPLSLAYSGNFGFTALLRFPLSETNKGEIANLFYFNPVTKKLELQSVSLINKDGYAEFPFTHASDYVIAISSKVMLENEMEQITVTPAKKTLYIGGTSSKSITIKTIIPKVIKETVADGLSKISITYQSSNPKIATVYNSGKIIAKKTGKATITTTVTVNGVKKSFKTTITVKKAYEKHK